MVEYLMLMAAAFITGYIIISGPLANFTASTLGRIRGTLLNIVRNGELAPGGQNPGEPGHPSRRERLKALHL